MPSSLLGVGHLRDDELIYRKYKMRHPAISKITISHKLHLYDGIVATARLFVNPSVSREDASIVAPLPGGVMIEKPS